MCDCVSGERVTSKLVINSLKIATQTHTRKARTQTISKVQNRSPVLNVRSSLQMFRLQGSLPAPPKSRIREFNA